MVRYHDEEWGTPVRDDQELFGHLCLDGFQAGLSWMIVLRKRSAIQKRFFGFDMEKCAALTDRQLEEALEDPGIIRNRLKVHAVRKNAIAALAVIEEAGSLSDFLWSFVDGEPIVNGFTSLGDLPASTDRSDAMAKALKKRGFSFVGSTICYAFMQAVGMVVDHEVGCFRYQELARVRQEEGSRKKVKG
jgi:DNA-3-methyladenine glycosylase I